MEPIDIGLWVTGGLLVMVLLGMRVAFAAALAGMIGLIWIFWAKKGYDPEDFGWALGVAVKTAGQAVPASIAFGKRLIETTDHWPAGAALPDFETQLIAGTAALALETLGAIARADAA